MTFSAPARSPDKPNSDIHDIQSKLNSVQTSIDVITQENKDLLLQNKLLMQQLLENNANDQQSAPTAPTPPIIDPTLFRQLIQATHDQTAELCTARTNQEAKASRKTPQKNTFPPCNVTSVNEFIVWENKILAIMATPEWSPLYDNTKNDIIDKGSLSPDLNNHFYSSLSNAMKGNNAAQNKRHLYQNGVGFYQALRSVYRPCIPLP